MTNQERDKLLRALQDRFDRHARRHPAIAWAEVQQRLIGQPEALRGRVANGALRRTMSNQASAFTGSRAHAATVCCARTSNGLAGIRMVSISPAIMRCTLTAQPMTSVRCLGNRTP